MAKLNELYQEKVQGEPILSLPHRQYWLSDKVAVQEMAQVPDQTIMSS